MTGASLRHRADGAVELRVNGVFVMDNVETSSERALAHAVLAAGARRLLVGGLGLGFTIRDILADPRVESVVVAEIEADIVCWMRDGVIAGADLLADPRLEVRIGDVRDVITALPDGCLDAIVLDVDNGPDHLVYDANAAIYQSAFLALCAQRLTPHGSLSLWSQADSLPLRAALAEHFVRVDAEAMPITLQGRDENYWIVRGHAPIPPR